MSEPFVKLVNIFPRAYDNFVATARTCYSAKGIVEIEDVAGGDDADESELERRRKRKHALARSLFKAGHHTTLQHAHVQFALDHVSRHFIWSFLHSHPFYNSEQVSQRYVSVKEGNFHVPESLSVSGREVFLRCVRHQMQAYKVLGERLKPIVADKYYSRFKGRYGSRRSDVDIQKKSQEAARYVLPIATFAYLYHTVSVLTLLRYYRISQEFDTSAEQRRVVQEMVAALLREEPEFETILEGPVPLEETPEYRFFADRMIQEVDTTNAKQIVGEFDKALGNSTSVLSDWGMRNEESVATAVREVLGVPRSLLSNHEAIELVLNPEKNVLYRESMNLSTLSKLTRTLFHARYTFRKRLSHTADSQDQRHRLTPGSRPILMRHYTGEPDYVIPTLLEEDSDALRMFRESMHRTWEHIEELLRTGESPEDAAYLLPNAVNVRFTESSDLLGLHHKMAMRLCYNAQEEIWKASLDETRAIEQVNPEIGKWLLPPCAIRKLAGAKPVCPEGDRYCGIPVWRLDKKDYQRVI